ncbi:MAG: zinc-binding dehydrogenase [Spirochaetes bacterium]|nr:zinc-binding dehydrogenase [Spirochaetota bacterium]
MKAAVVNEDGRLEIREIPLPEYNEYQALVKLCYGSTCAGTDLRILRKQHQNPLVYPSILGHESVGRICEMGTKVNFFKKGDLISRVGAPPMPEIGLGICWGGFAQYGIATDWQAMERDGIPREKWEKARVQKVIPDSVSEKDAPMMITWRETLSYANRVGVKPGDKILIAGSGANALAFICHCVYANAEVVMLGNRKRGNDAARLGARLSIDYKSDDISAQLLKVFPCGIDTIIDAVGYATNVNAALPLLKEDGTVAVYGWNSRVDYGINPFLAKRSFKVYCDGYDEPETHDEVLLRISEKRLCASDWYDEEHPVPLCDISSAYERLNSHESYKYLIDLG